MLSLFPRYSFFPQKQAVSCPGLRQEYYPKSGVNDESVFNRPRLRRWFHPRSVINIESLKLQARRLRSHVTGLMADLVSFFCHRFFFKMTTGEEVL